mgnify:CR=1 FL=1
MFIKLISKEDGYYDTGTEVFDYDGNRFALDQFYQALKENCLLCRGLVNGQEDGDQCVESEFIFEIVEDYKHIDDYFEELYEANQKEKEAFGAGKEAFDNLVKAFSEKP